MLRIGALFFNFVYVPSCNKVCITCPTKTPCGYWLLGQSELQRLSELLYEPYAPVYKTALTYFPSPTL